MATDPDDLALTDADEQALHEMQLGIEYVHRAYGTLLEFHHELGHAMDRMGDAEDALRETGHEEWANELRDDHLPAGAVSDQGRSNSSRSSPRSSSRRWTRSRRRSEKNWQTASTT